MLKKIRNRPWYPSAVAACIAVMLYGFLMHFEGFWGKVSAFVGYFSPVITGMVIAYMVNPLARLYHDYILRFLKKKPTVRRILSNTLAFLTVFAFIIFFLITLIPQLISSVRTFVGNLDRYVLSIKSMLESLHIHGFDAQLDDFVKSSETILEQITRYIQANYTGVISVLTDIGSRAFQLTMSFTLAVYCLAAKSKQESGFKRMLRASMPRERYERVMDFLHRGNQILTRYIVYNVLESIIVGGANAVFMTIMGLPYVGLVSFTVAIFNMVPTFGPVVGGAIGALILFLVEPWYALAFLIFTMVLQTVDGYVIKPKLFGNSLGVSGLWILIAIIVSSRMFGVVGILLAIPAIAILDFLYEDYLMPYLEKRRAQEDSEAAEKS